MIGYIRNVVGGFLMGSADLVPGVSGGTIALILGIYERLVASIREGSSALGAILTGRPEEFREHLRSVEWGLLIPLLAGILLAVVTLASLIESQLEERPTIMAGAFLGLVVGSVLIAWRLVTKPRTGHLAISVGVAAVLFLALGLGDDSSATDPSLIVFVAAGALAICAMILPGISGSLILLLVGMYTPVIGAVNDREFVTILLFALGAIIGLALFSQILHWALERYHDAVLAGLVGLMLGSLRILWPWPEGVEGADLAVPADDWPLVLVSTGLGLAAVFVISRIAGMSSVPSGQQPIG